MNDFLSYVLIMNFVAWLPLIVIVLIVCAAFGGRRRAKEPEPRSCGTIVAWLIVLVAGVAFTHLN